MYWPFDLLQMQSLAICDGVLGLLLQQLVSAFLGKDYSWYGFNLCLTKIDRQLMERKAKVLPCQYYSPEKCLLQIHRTLGKEGKDQMNLFKSGTSHIGSLVSADGNTLVGGLINSDGNCRYKFSIKRTLGGRRMIGRQKFE